MEEIRLGHILAYKIVQCPNTFVLHSFTPQILLLQFGGIFFQFRKLSHQPSMWSYSRQGVGPLGGGLWGPGKCSPPGQHSDFSAEGHCALAGAVCRVCAASQSTPSDHWQHLPALTKHSEASASPSSTEGHEH